MGIRNLPMGPSPLVAQEHIAANRAAPERVLVFHYALETHVDVSVCNFSMAYHLCGARLRLETANTGTVLYYGLCTSAGVEEA